VNLILLMYTFLSLCAILFVLSVMNEKQLVENLIYCSLLASERDIYNWMWPEGDSERIKLTRRS